MILFADDFNGYGAGGQAYMLNGLYGQVSGTVVSDPDPTVISRTCYNYIVNALNGYKLRRVFPGVRTTAGAAFRLWLDQLPPNNTCLTAIGFLDAGSAFSTSMSIDTLGKIRVHTGDATGAIVGQTTGPVLTANAWNHIEFKMVASATVGTFEVRVNGINILSGSGVNTGTDYSQFCMSNQNSVGTSTNYYVKDLVTWDSTGTHNTNFLGTVSVLALIPASDVSLNWTPSSGTTGYNLINAAPPSDSTNYIKAPTPPPAAAKFNMSQLPTNVTSVRAMITQVRAAKSDGGDGSVQASLISSGVAAAGSNRPITTAFTYYEDIFEVDPNTTSNWTVAAANAAQLKIDRTV